MGMSNDGHERSDPSSKTILRDRSIV